MRVYVATEPVPGQENEDAVFRQGAIVAVLDGVTRPSGLDNGCVHSVAWYVDTLTQGLAIAVNAQPTAPLPELLSTAIAGTRQAHAGHCDLTNPSTPAAAVALIRRAPVALEYLVLCDAFIVADDGTTANVITDSRFENVIREIRARHLVGEGEYGTAAHGARFRAAAVDKRSLTNTDAGYWIAAADPEAAHHGVAGELPLAGPGSIRRACLLTDGASRAVDLFGLLTWAEALDLVEEFGPGELIQRVRKAELEDPNGEVQPRFKRHDDATVALCVLEETL